MLIPDSVIEIGESAFEKCKHLQTVESRGRSKLKTIRKNCFYQSGLEDVWFSVYVENIEQDAFSGCQKLSSVLLDAS